MPLAGVQHHTDDGHQGESREVTGQMTSTVGQDLTFIPNKSVQNQLCYFIVV